MGNLNAGDVMGRKLKIQKTIFSIFEEIKPEINKIAGEMINQNMKIVKRKLDIIYDKYSKRYPLLKNFYFVASFDSETNDLHVQVERRINGINNSPK